MFPYRDENPTRGTPYFVYLFVAANLAVALYGWLGTANYGAWLDQWGLRPSALMGRQEPGTLSPWLGLLASPWLHANLAHLAGNLWFLWLFGDNVEDQLGHGRFVAFYLLCGFLATATHVVANPESFLPLVGASGAIAGVLGAYLRFFPRHRVRTLLIVFILVYRIRVPAAFFILLWLAAQVVGQLAWTAAHGTDLKAGGVAFGAHLGGFLAGLLLAGPFGAGRPAPRKPPRVGTS